MSGGYGFFDLDMGKVFPNYHKKDSDRPESVFKVEVTPHGYFVHERYTYFLTRDEFEKAVGWND